MASYLVEMGLNGRTKASVEAESFGSAAIKAAKECERECQYGMAGPWTTTAIVTRADGPLSVKIGESQTFTITGKVTTEYFAERKVKPKVIEPEPREYAGITTLPYRDKY